MRIKIEKINKIFIKKMIYSLLAQLLILSLLIIFVRDYINDNQANIISNDLLIKDQYTLEKIGKYRLIKSNYALDLELHNLGEIRKLDRIKFVRMLPRHQCNILNLKQFKLCKLNDSYLGISAITVNHRILGYIIATKKYYPIISGAVTYDFLLILLSIIATFAINIGLLFLPLKKKIEDNTQSLLSFISKEKHEDNAQIPISIEEYKTVALQFIDERRKITTLQIEKSRYEIRKNIAELVAHDIRSLLAAINTAVSDVTSIPENKRIMIRNAAKRINDIANNLLLQSKNNFDVQDKKIGKNDSPELIFVVLDNIVAEKRYEYYKTNVNINLTGSDYSYNCFSNINLGSFKRVLSNLINNSIEAINSNGTIIISLTCNATHVEIIIEDNGCGIPADILSKVTELGFSFNKKNGAGFGLSYTKQYLEQINGTMHIHSEEKIGTKITISLLRSNHPNWFCDSMNVQQNSVIMVLDDDPSIHEAWDERFTTISHVKILHSYNVFELLQHKISPWIPILYLVDYELLADTKNGLDVIKELKLNDKAILVTSCFEDITIRTRCENMGVRIIPKSYVPYIQIIQIPEIKYPNRLVFIDNDDMMRTIWRFAAEEAGQSLSTYASFEEFINESHHYSKKTIIYIDSDLGNDIKGEVCARHLFDKGFNEIHLATGHSQDRFDNLPWIKTVIGKEPPFLLAPEHII